MGINPSDITNLMNEALNASNKISTAQFDSAQGMSDQQAKISENTKKLKRTIKSTIEQLDMFSQEPKKKTKKLQDPTLKILSDLADSLSKKSKDVPQKPKIITDKVVKKEINHIDKFYMTNSILNVKGNLVVNTKKFPIDINKQSQSTQDFYRTDDLTNENNSKEIELLKSIEKHLAGGNSTPGLLESLLGGFAGLSKMFVGAKSAGIGGVLGGMLGMKKFGKLGNVLKPLSKIGKKISSLKDSAKLLKRPKLLIPLMMAGAGYAIYDMIRDGVFTTPVDQLGAEQREKGGSVLSGKPYIVGEKGPELFTPRESGRIIPNNKISNNEETDYSIMSEISDYVRTLSRKTSKLTEHFTENLEFVLYLLKPSNLFKMIKQGIKLVLGKARDVVGQTTEKVKEGATNVVNTGINVVNAATNNMGLGKLFELPKINFPSAQPSTQGNAPARRIGDKNVPKDMAVTLHKNEMVIPAVQSEALRAIAKLQNQNMNVSKPQEVITRSQLGKEFWMNEFVPQFSEMVKNKKMESNKYKSYNVGNIFGAG